MRNDKELWSDDFDISADDDEMASPDYDGDTELLGDFELPSQRSTAAWQRIEDRLEERRLKAMMCDWDDLDEDYPAIDPSQPRTQGHYDVHT